MSETYQALVIEKNQDRSFVKGTQELPLDNLPDEEVLIRVHFSTINYKDILSCQGNPAITRRFPHTPGIDAGGVVVSSKSSAFSEGEKVVVVCQPMGLNSPGGYGQYISVPATWVYKLSAETDLEYSMAYGTAGFTAALAVNALQDLHGELAGKNIAVTGATGGVGCVSVMMLSTLGAKVTAITGKSNAESFLETIGADNVIPRSELEGQSRHNLLRQQWDCAIDVAGGATLATILKMINDGGTVVATGLADDTALNTTVLPFILRGLKLIGINAESADDEKRNAMWSDLLSENMTTKLSSIYETVKLADLAAMIDKMEQSEQLGRVVVDMR